MQFLTIRQSRTGTNKHMRQFGGRGQYFVFGYEVSHDPIIEALGVKLGPNVEDYFSREYWPDISAGVQMGWEVAHRRGVRLCCVNLLMPFLRDAPVDTTQQIVRECVAEFVQTRIVGWSEPIELRPEWLTSDVVALARGIHANSALDGLPALTDALLEAGCDDPLVIEHLMTCTDHAPSCWVVEMIREQTGL